ncbi:type I-E CRISPR-associated protein Cas6/Cse3/CasE [Streptomyces sp. NA02950]|uniref:type I-E CRISPR-associated protein Cas6/Cse3/CasE n=1 Tax=Streptomyces sp. NA02950 TaxID=2742137 RepID=UPI0020CAC1C0|nr:type I-E CRISPR-associated protein Cas6/Cse3/CasE [Streptomyces sp. NA02950]
MAQPLQHPTPSLPPRAQQPDRLRNSVPKHINYADTRRITRVQDSGSRPPGKTTREMYNLKPVIPLSGTAADDWWIRQAQQSGLTVHTVLSTPLDAARGEHAQGKHRIRHARTRFDGTAAIADPGLFQRRLIEGTGRGKAYGCGLLSLAPA